MKDTITEKEATSHREIEKVTSMADRENWELRRKLDKVTNSHEDELSKRDEAHSAELGEHHWLYERIVSNTKESKLSSKHKCNIS